MKKITILFSLITTALVAQNGFNNWDCFDSYPGAYEIYTAGGGLFSNEVNQALNQFCDSLDNVTNPNNDGDDPSNSDGVFIICNGEEIVIDTLDLINNPEEFYVYIESLNCEEAQDWANGGVDQIFGCTDQLAINFNATALEDDGSCEYDCVCQPVNQTVCGSDGLPYANSCVAACAGVDFTYGECDNSIDSEDVFIICNGEEIVIDTLELLNSPEAFYEYIESLNCAEAEDWLNEGNDPNLPEPQSYFSWDCIYNYPEASDLYMDYGNTEASESLEEFCLAVANGEWMWGEDPTQWPITCEEGTSIATVEFETAGFGFEDEISWSLEQYEGTIGLTPVCLEDGCSQFNMFDSWGDGWGGITFTINSPDGVLLTGSLDDGFVQSLPFGLNTSELCFDVTEVENPDAYTCFEDVFPGIGNIDFETMYPNMEMTNEDLFFIIEDTDVDFSVFTENGIEFTAQEMDGYLLFGPISIDDLISFVIGLGMDESSIPWGYFRPANNEVVAQGFLNKDNMELPNNFSTSFEAASTVVDIIVGSPDHTTLAAAVGAAGLVETLSGDGPFTVFAPTDAAFALLPEGLVATLLEDPTGQLTTILTHHVYAGSALSTDLYDGMMVPTIAGGALEVTFPMEMVHIGDAMVTTADLQADNGVVHVINAVLIPEEGLSIHESLLLEDNAEYLYSIDVLGKKVAADSRGIIIFDKYSSGKVVKRFIK
ncbi:MAG: fasciclin domain-containing protein [Flavobacteriales bacterium]|nr:fasciclin domain-containing protein [Flavobacteriales bacterium]